MGLLNIYSERCKKDFATICNVSEKASIDSLQVYNMQKLSMRGNTGKNNGFPFLDILGYLKNTHKNPKFGKKRQVPTREFPIEFPDWDLSHSSKFGIFVGIL